MRRTSTMSVLGLYDFDSTLFDNMSLPSGVDKPTLVNNLLMELAELEVLYSSPVFMKSAITQWSAKEVNNWTKEYNALSSTYTALNNYDRTENISESVSSTATGSSSGSTTGTSSSSNKVAGYNSETLKQSSGNDVTDGTTTSNTNNASGSNNRISTIKLSGNVGVKPQDMLASEIELREKYNIYDLIINDFKNRFCILVY